VEGAFPMPNIGIKGQKASNLLNAEFISTSLQLLGVISIPATVLGFVAAFLGWRSSSAYLLTFGIGPGWVTSDIPSLIVNAWLEVGLIVFIMALFLASRLIIGKILENIRPTYRIIILIELFLVLICLLIYISLRFFVIKDIFFFWDIFYLEGSGLLTWWVFTVVIDQILRTPPEHFNGLEKKVRNLFSLFFSLRLVVLLITLTLFAGFILNFAVMHGTYYGIRDLGPRSHLPIIDITSNTHLGISNEKFEMSMGKGVFHYEGLRLAMKTDDYIFAFYINEVNRENITSKIYIVPVKNIEWLTIHQWDWTP
jgi:hypothetical protein